MGKQYKSETVRCNYFTWKIFKRDAVYYADGRTGNAIDLGKHSLGAKRKEKAIDNLNLLDRAQAIKAGLIKPVRPAQADTTRKKVSISQGWNLFLEHCERPDVLGGVSVNTLKRYRAVRDKHFNFCSKTNITSWNDFGKKQAESYGKWLSSEDYADRSIYLELNLLISVIKWMVEEKYLNSGCRISLSLTKPEGTDTYCYTRKEVSRMIAFCEGTELGRWIRPIIVALASTGMRIGELTNLRWKDVDFDVDVITVVDDRFSQRKKAMGSTRTTKGKRSRSLPLNRALKEVLLQQPRYSDGFVFHGLKGGRLKDKTVLDIFKRVVRKPLAPEFSVPEGEIGFQHGTIHSFRHYFVSESFRQGASEAEIMDWVGHRKSAMVHHYRHLRADDSQRRMQSINFVEDDAGSISK